MKMKFGGFGGPVADMIGLVIRTRRHAPSVLFALGGDGEVHLQRIRGPLDVRVSRKGSHLVNVPVRLDGRRRGAR